MSDKISMKAAEIKVFQTSFNDGLWEIFLGCFFLEFAIAPLLSVYLGDFWSVAVFLPFWGLAYLVVSLIRRYIVKPRIGHVKLGSVRKTKLMKFTLVMLVFNSAIFILGILAAVSFGRVSGFAMSILVGMILLLGFSLAAYMLDFQRLYLYGLLVGIAPLVGEWLYRQGLASHHGFPITFGTISAILILVGLAQLLRLLHNNPLPGEELPSESA